MNTSHQLTQEKAVEVSYTRTSFRPSRVVYPEGFGVLKLQPDVGLSDIPLIRVKKDGTRVYYNEERLIHRDPNEGPAIEYEDGSGPCYLRGAETGEVYESVVETVEAPSAPITLADYLGVTTEENSRAIKRAESMGVTLEDAVNDLNGRTHREATVLKRASIVSVSTEGATPYRMSKKAFDMGKIVMAVARGKSSAQYFTDVLLPDRRLSAEANLKSGKVAPIRERRVAGTLSLSGAVYDLRSKFKKGS